MSGTTEVNLENQQQVFSVRARASSVTPGPDPVPTAVEITPDGDVDIQCIWDNSCASIQYPDIAAFKAAIQAETLIAASQPTYFATGANFNSANETSIYHPVYFGLRLCLDMGWIKIYIWLHI